MKESIKILLPILMALPSQAFSWAEGVDYDEPLSCPTLALNGAEKLIVRVKPISGSYGLPKLVGLKDEKVLWVLDFPKTDDLNVAKFYASCKKNKIILWYQSPGVNVALVQEYTWNGKALKKIRQYHKQ